jgi:hypothetical protein
MLNQVERRRFLIKPARKDTVPAPVGLLHIDLYKSAGQFLLFPWGSRLTGAKAHDHVLPSNRLAGMKRDVLNDAVALVENAENRCALGHWSNTALAIGGRGNLAPASQGRILSGPTLAARSERERGEQGCSEVLHVYSGIQGS